MNSQLTRTFAVSIAAALLSFDASAAQRADARSARNDADPAAIALSRCAQRAGLDASQLRIVAASRGDYPLLGRTTSEFKLITSSGDSLSIALDEHGQEIDAENLRLREDLAHTKTFGAIDPQLFAELFTADASLPLAVAVWLDEPDFESMPLPEVDGPSPVVEDPTHAEAFDAELARAYSAHLVGITMPVVAALTDMGVVAIADEAAPLVYVSLTPEQIRQVARWEGVSRVYSAKPMLPLLDRARQEILVGNVHAMGINGSGVKIAQVEVGGRVAFNLLIGPFVQDTTYVCTTPNDHATAVAGILKSFLPTAFGIAYGSQMFATGSCGGWVDQIHNRTSAGMGFGARSFNLSFGQDTNRVPGVSDRFYDNLVISRRRTFVVAAGNEGQYDGDVLSPGLAYNVVTVGSYDMGANTWWGDETMSVFSSYRNPVSAHGDREKPDLVAPGSNIRTALNNGGWGANYSTPPFAPISGTSFAAPMVTGVTALMMQRNGNLIYWPEAVKSILMTTAIHNIEGATRLSDRDGAGGLNALLADEVVRRMDGDWGGMAYNCSFPTDYDVRTFYASQGQRVRASIAWSTPTNYVNYGARPSADLDLYIVNSSGSIVSSSSSWESTTEIVDFVAPASGYYRIRVHKHDCQMAPRNLGWSLWVKPSIG